MRIREREIEFSEYLTEWYNAKYQEWNEFLAYLNRTRHEGIYRLDDGPEILQLAIDIIENLNAHLSLEVGRHIIPSRFPSIMSTLQFLERLDEYVSEKIHIVEQHFDAECTDQDIVTIASIWYEYHAMFVRCKQVYSEDENIPIPYLRIRDCLYDNNIPGFIDLLKSTIKSIPFNIHKEKVSEGYFHTLVHIMMSVLGMKPISEAETNDGRIDMMIETPMRIFILEFKYVDKNSSADKAFKQIVDKEYAQAYHIYNKDIIGVGICFSGEKRNICENKTELLYSPQQLKKSNVYNCLK